MTIYFITDIFNAYKGRYGYRRVWDVMRSRGYVINHKTVLKLMKLLGLKGKQRKGNCIDNGAMENFFGRLRVEMFYGEKFESVDAFIAELHRYIHYYNNDRIYSKLKMSPVQYRAHSQLI